MLGDVNKRFVFKNLLTTPSNVLPLHFKTFLPIIWIFTEGDWIESRLPSKIFSTLLGVCTRYVWNKLNLCAYEFVNIQVKIFWERNKIWKIFHLFFFELLSSVKRKVGYFIKFFWASQTIWTLKRENIYVCKNAPSDGSSTPLWTL